MVVRLAGIQAWPRPELVREALRTGKSIEPPKVPSGIVLG